MKKSGYTLVELIAMVVVIGVLMVITVPNIAGIIRKSKEDVTVEDVNRIVSDAKQKMVSGKIKYPKTYDCVLMNLRFIDTNNDFTTTTNGTTYDLDNSYVVVKKEKRSATSSIYKYYLRLLTEKDGEQYELNFVDYDEFIKEPSNYNFVPYSSLIKGAVGEDYKEMINNLAGYTLCENVSSVGIKM